MTKTNQTIREVNMFNYDPDTTTTNELLSLIGFNANQEERTAIKNALSKSHLSVFEWLKGEKGKPEVIRDLDREQRATESLKSALDKIVTPLRARTAKSSEAKQLAKKNKDETLKECATLCSGFHKEITELLNKRGLRVEDTNGAVAKAIAYSALVK